MRYKEARYAPNTMSRVLPALQPRLLPAIRGVTLRQIRIKDNNLLKRVDERKPVAYKEGDENGRKSLETKPEIRGDN